MIGDMIEGAPHILRQQLEEPGDGRVELANAKILVQVDCTGFDAGQQVFVVAIELLKVLVLFFCSNSALTV